MTPEISDLIAKINELKNTEKLLKEALDAHYNFIGKIAITHNGRKFTVDRVTYFGHQPLKISGLMIRNDGKPGKLRCYQYQPFKFEDSTS